MISKLFKNKKLETLVSPKAKSYVQVSKQNIGTLDVIKIKEIFPFIGAKKIDQINDIVKGFSKPKPHIQMTIKGLSRKQVIILMGNNNNINQ